MSIPKIIHYIWFGEKKIPEKERECIESWKKMMPDYEIMFWNEETFELEDSPYAKQALKHKKYAFASDYARVKVLYEYGGIYFDTDVETVKSLDPFLDNKAFAGFENRTMVGTGIMGCIPKSKIMKEMLEYYAKHDFEDEKGNIDITTNVQIFNRILLKEGLEKENKEQILEDIHVYERDIFCPKKMDDGTFRTTDRTVTIHYLSGSWLTEREKRRGTNKLWRNVCRPVLKKVREGLIGLVGEKRARKIEIQFRKVIK